MVGSAVVFAGVTFCNIFFVSGLWYGLAFCSIFFVIGLWYVLQVHHCSCVNVQKLHQVLGVFL